MIKKIKILLPVITLLLASCGGGGGSGPETSSSKPAISPALPATEVNNAAPDTPMSKEEAFRLLEQTTFGARLKDINSISGNGPEVWIDDQMALPATFLSDGLRSAKNDRWNEYVNVWWRHAINADDQLRQRVAFALSAAWFSKLLRHIASTLFRQLPRAHRRNNIESGDG